MSINPVYSALKALDQPRLIENFRRSVPYLLPATFFGFTAYDWYKAPQHEKKRRVIKSASIGVFTTAAALAGFAWLRKPEPDLLKQAVEKVVAELKEDGVKLTPKLSELLEKAKSKVLGPFEVHKLRKELHAASPKGAAQVSEIIPDPENLAAKDIFGEIGRLSLLGLFPVLGGVAGGVAGNMLNRDPWRRELKNQAKEGLFQYLANIFLCNVGAGLALWGLEKTKYSGASWARMAAMSVGIIITGVVCGSVIANFFGKNFFNPMFEKGPAFAFRHLKEKISTEGVGSLFRKVNEERHPEVVDVALHADDFATVGVLAGLKWIEPALPFLYSFSGYRAGIGYRNGETGDKESHQGSVLGQPEELRFQGASTPSSGRRLYAQGFGHFEQARGITPPPSYFSPVPATQTASYEIAVPSRPSQNVFASRPTDVAESRNSEPEMSPWTTSPTVPPSWPPIRQTPPASLAWTPAYGPSQPFVAG